MVDTKIFESILNFGTEGVDLEFREDFEYDSIFLRERLLKSILALSNTKGGGRVLIGIKDETLERTGLNADNSKSLKNKLDELKSQVQKFSSGAIDIKFSIYNWNNKEFLFMEVEQYLEYPNVCKVDGQFVYEDSEGIKKKMLEKGAIYVRSISDKPSSIKLSDPLDVASFFENALSKNLEYKNSKKWYHLYQRNDGNDNKKKTKVKTKADYKNKIKNF